MAVCTPGFLVAVAVFLQFVVLITVVKSFGMMLTYIQTDLGVDTWVLGSIFAVVECVSDLFGPVVGSTGGKFGARPVVMAGGIAVAVGLVIASQASSVSLMALPLIALVGTGNSFAILTRAELGQHFDVRTFALASGCSHTGVAVALIVQPPLIQTFLDTYGWRGTMLILASLGAHFVVCGALLRPPRTVDQSIYRSLEQMTSETSQPKQLGFLATVYGGMYRAFNLSLMKNSRFWMVAVIVVVTRILRGAWTIYFVPHVVAKGFNNDEAAVLVTVAGVGQLIGILLSGVVLYKEIVTSTTAMLVTVTIIAVSSLTDPWMMSGWSLAINGAAFMCGVGSTFTIVDVMVKEFLGREKMASAFGWMGFISGIFRFFSGFIPGWIYDHSGSYDVAFIILGTLQFSSIIPLLIKCYHDNSKR